MSAGQSGAKSHTADCLLFRQENDFHMTVSVGHWLANS